MPFDAQQEVRALRALLKSANGLARAATRLDTLPRAVLVADDIGHYIAANQQACALSGYSKAELLTRSVSDLTPPPEAGAQDRLWRAFERAGRQTGRYSILRKDGSTVDVEYEAFWDVVPGIHVSFLLPVEAETR